MQAARTVTPVAMAGWSLHWQGQHPVLFSCVKGTPAVGAEMEMRKVLDKVHFDSNHTLPHPSPRLVIAIRGPGLQGETGVVSLGRVCR